MAHFCVKTDIQGDMAMDFNIPFQSSKTRTCSWSHPDPCSILWVCPLNTTEASLYLNGVVHVWVGLSLWMRRMCEWGKVHLWRGSKKTAGYGGSSIQTSQISPRMIKAFPLPSVSALLKGKWPTTRKWVYLYGANEIDINFSKRGWQMSLFIHQLYTNFAPFSEAFWYIYIFSA